MPRRPNANCSTCDKPVIRGKSSRPEIICHECRRKDPHSASGKTTVPAICEECGSEFQSRRNGHSVTGWTRYCSRSCVIKARGYVPGGNPEHNRNRWASLSDAARHRARQRARARHRNRQVTWDGVTDEQILERDRWMCRMDKCLYGSRRINPKRKYPDKRSASIDHIVPLARGGDDTGFNKRAAHLGCNMARSTGRPGEQMTLDFVTAAPVARARRKPVRKPRPCKVCGELRSVGQACSLHEPVRYADCQVCHTPMIKRGPAKSCEACRTRSCAVAGCTGQVFYATTDWCAGHYHRHNRKGDVFADIPLADRTERFEVATRLHAARSRVA